MIELNDKQADKICEIVNIRFHHYEKAKYEDFPYNDTDPQYYFYPDKMVPSAFKVNRLTGELRFDEMFETSNEMVKTIGEYLLNSGNADDEVNESLEKAKKHYELKDKVKQYLISEGLI